MDDALIKGWFLALTSIGYNLVTIYLVAICLRSMNIKLMLKEKTIRVTRTVVTAAPGQQAPAAPPIPVDVVANNSNGDGDSYSRITGCAGAVVLTSFIWALGNAVIYNAYMSPDAVGKLLTDVAPFILSGAALFAPYAFNQLSSVFPPKS